MDFMTDIFPLQRNSGNVQVPLLVQIKTLLLDPQTATGLESLGILASLTVVSGGQTTRDIV